MKKFLVLLFMLIINPVFAKDMRFVQISDANFDAENRNMLAAAVSEINKQPDIKFVIFTGDNIAKPSKEYLEGFLDEAKRLNCPFYIVFGDHDVNRYKDLSKADYIKIIKKKIKKYKPEAPNYSFEYDGVVFVAADGSKDVLPGTNGFYKEDTLNWIQNELSWYPEQNIIIFQHFPLIPPSDREAYYTFKPERYLKILKSHKNVKAVFAGHFGVNSEKEAGGILHYATAGLPCYRVIDIMDYDTKNPVFWTVLREVSVR